MTRLTTSTNLTTPPRQRRLPPRASQLVLWLCLPALLLALAPAPVPIPVVANQDKELAKTAPYPRKGEYAGKADCVECHEQEEAQIEGGHHKPVIHAGVLQGCETCHGPGKKHADDEDSDPMLITHPRKLSRRKQQEVLCGRCHEDQIAAHGGDLEGFFVAGKTCTDCHSIHTKIKAPPHANKSFASRAAVTAAAKPVGAAKCITCHPVRDQLLGHTHPKLASRVNNEGCETCHGHGSLHVETGGLARLISRPDTAMDGAKTCAGCHEAVDPFEFHWKGKHKPLLSEGMTCTTCHQIHRAPTATAAAAAKETAKATAPTPTNALCARCHEPALHVLTDTIHQTLGESDTPLAQGCGGCHEGAEQHALAGGKRSLVNSLRGSDAKHQVQTCGQCHQKDQAMRHARRGAHFKNEVTCLSCHSPAAKKGKDAVRADATQKCQSCHQKVAAEFKRPNHHPIGEHGMSCVDCHDPHSARPRIRNRELRQKKCVSCHKQYRGPFVFNHQASRTDGCVACHTPHGSTNKNLLKQSRSQQNCIACHGDFPSFHDQTSGAVFTNCLKCHTQVHGSNHSRYFFR